MLTVGEPCKTLGLSAREATQLSTLSLPILMLSPECLSVQWVQPSIILVLLRNIVHRSILDKRTGHLRSVLVLCFYLTDFSHFGSILPLLRYFSSAYKGV